MARKANPALVGAFVIGAVVLAVAGLVIFGGGKMFRETRPVVAYFEGSLKGLAIGSPVTFNGIKIGSVTDMKVIVDPKDTSIRTPVFFEIDAGRFEEAGGGRISFAKGAPGLKKLIDQGLRAQLELQSLVTGQLAVALKFVPGAPLRLTGLSTDYPEIPTVGSGLDKLAKLLENLPIDALVADALETLHSVNKLVRAPEIKSALGSLDRVAANADALVREVNAQIAPLIAAVTKTASGAQDTMTDVRTAVNRLVPVAEAALAEYQGLAVDARKLADHADGRINTLASALEKRAAAAEATLGEARSLINEDSPLRYDLANALREVQGAARSLRVLADYLERHPESLVVGKRAEKNP